MMHPYRTEEITQKADLANWLCLQLKASSYLEIATGSTGFQFGRISRSLFSTVHRALYRLPADYDDGLPVTFPSGAADSRECKAGLLDGGRHYDVVFLDPWHTYESSIEDMELGLSLLAPGGIMVVHDCHPTRPEIAGPDFREGEWMGVTYVAFLDLMRNRPELDYCVADMDYGCAVIWRRKAGKPVMLNRTLLATCNYRDWDTFFANRKQLLNLLTTHETLQHLRKRPFTTLVSASYKLLNAAGKKWTVFEQNPRVKKAMRITKRFTRRILGMPPA